MASSRGSKDENVFHVFTDEDLLEGLDSEDDLDDDFDNDYDDNDRLDCYQYQDPDDIEYEEKTPLMIACEKANKEAVIKLLKSAPDRAGMINKTWGKTGNSALHFTCIDKSAMFSLYSYGKKNKIRSEIARLLLKCGAVYKENAKGMTPVYLAAVHGLKDLQTYLCNRSEVKSVAPMDERAKGEEFLGIATTLYKEKANEALEYFLRAKAMRQHAKVPNGPHLIPELLECFGRAELESSEEMKKMKRNKSAIQIETFLIAARVFTKESFPWFELFSLALKNMKKYPVYKKPLLYAVKQMVVNKIRVKQMLEAVEDNLKKLAGSEKARASFLNDILEAFLAGLKEADNSWVHSNMADFGQKCAMILRRFVEGSSGPYEKLLSTTEKIIVQLYAAERAWLEEYYRGPTSLGCAYKVIESIFMHGIITAKFCDERTYSKLLHVISRLLHLEGADHDVDWKSMLHLLVDSIHAETDHDFDFDDDTEESFGSRYPEYKRFFLAVVNMVVRHGCPLDAKDHRDRCSARQSLLNYYDEFYPEQPTEPWYLRFLELLTKPPSPLRLEELSARYILQEKIPYREALTEPLRGYVSGVPSDPYKD